MGRVPIIGFALFTSRLYFKRNPVETAQATKPQNLSRAATGMLGRILAIAHNTFREAVRDRVLYNLVLFVLLTGVAIFIGELPADKIQDNC